MTDYRPPTENVPIFDSLNFLSGDEYLTFNQAKKYFLRYPYAQGLETFPAGIAVNTIQPIAITNTVNLFTTQTTGVLNIGTSATRSGAINIGTGATASTPLNIGIISGPNIVMAGRQIDINGGSGLPLNLTTTGIGTFSASAGLNLRANNTINIGDTQSTTNVLNIGTSAIRAGDINIGTGATNTGVIHIGDGNSNSGNVHIANGTFNSGNVNIANGIGTGSGAGQQNTGSVNIMTGAYNKGTLSICSGDNQQGTIAIMNGLSNTGIFNLMPTSSNSGNATIQAGGTNSGAFYVQSGATNSGSTYILDGTGNTGTFNIGRNSGATVNINVNATNSRTTNIGTGATNTGTFNANTNGGNVNLGNDTWSTRIKGSTLSIGTSASTIELNTPLVALYAGNVPTTKGSTAIGYQSSSTNNSPPAWANSTNLDFNSVSLGTGVWLVEGVCNITQSVTAPGSGAYLRVWLSTTSVSPDNTRLCDYNQYGITGSIRVQVQSVFTLSTTTTVYLSISGDMKTATITTNSGYMRYTRLA